jgi:hypothetical protein
MTDLALVPNPPAAAKPKTLTAKQANAVPTRIMGPHGPLRMFSQQPFHGGMAYEGATLRGFAAGYVCDACLKICEGLYRLADDRWLCRACKPRIKSMSGRASASTAPKVGNVITMPSRTRRTGQERSPCRRKRTRSK